MGARPRKILGLLKRSLRKIKTTQKEKREFKRLVRTKRAVFVHAKNKSFLSKFWLSPLFHRSENNIRKNPRDSTRFAKE